MTQRDSAVTRMRRELLDELLDGTYTSGVKLPNEDELAEQAGVSRATVREAVGALVEAGYLTRRHGSGTYVAGTLPRRHALDTSVSYLSMIREAGMAPGLVIVEKGVHEASAEEAEALKVEAGEAVLKVERIRTADGRPVVFSIDRMPLRYITSDPEELEASLYDVLQQSGHGVQGASATLTPVAADKRLADLLGATIGTPLLYIDQVDFDGDGHPVMLSAEWHVADAFEMHINRRAARAGSAAQNDDERP